MVQAGTTMLAQANASPQSVLKLLNKERGRINQIYRANPDG